MTTPPSTVADEIERYLRTGDTDPYHTRVVDSELLRARRTAIDANLAKGTFQKCPLRSPTK